MRCYIEAINSDLKASLVWLTASCRPVAGSSPPPPRSPSPGASFLRRWVFWPAPCWLCCLERTRFTIHGFPALKAQLHIDEHLWRNLIKLRHINLGNMNLLPTLKEPVEAGARRSGGSRPAVPLFQFGAKYYCSFRPISGLVGMRAEFLKAAESYNDELWACWRACVRACARAWSCHVLLWGTGSIWGVSADSTVLLLHQDKSGHAVNQVIVIKLSLIVCVCVWAQTRHSISSNIELTIIWYITHLRRSPWRCYLLGLRYRKNFKGILLLRALADSCVWMTVITHTPIIKGAKPLQRKAVVILLWILWIIQAQHTAALISQPTTGRTNN